MQQLSIRQIEPADYPLLEEFLYQAIFLPPGVEAPPREVIFEPEIHVYIKAFGGTDDCGVVAEAGGEIVGMAWTRIIPAYGHSTTPRRSLPSPLCRAGAGKA